MKTKPEKIMIDDVADENGQRMTWAMRFKNGAWHIDYRFQPMSIDGSANVRDVYAIYETQYLRNIGAV